MTNPWAFGGSPVGGAAENLVTLIDGSTFCISDPTGDITPGQAQGLYIRDTRVVSRWQLTVDGVPPETLTVQNGEPYAATFVGRIPPHPPHSDSTLLVVRRRYVGNGMREVVTVRNFSAQALTCRVRLLADTDFADLFEVKEGRTPAAAAVETEADGAALRLTGRRGEHLSRLLVRGEDAQTDSDGLVWTLAVPARGARTVTVKAVAVADGVPPTVDHPPGHPVEEAPARLWRTWRRRSPRVRTADADLAAVLRRTLSDLGALRIFDPDHRDRAVVAAGAPWFMALFGRDSLLTSWMVLPLDTSLALGTLQTLADHQGRDLDPATEEEPGRILHETRFGPAAKLALGGRSVYYGTADATPLFVMLLAELHRWGHHGPEIDALLPHADRALEWIEHYGDADGDGFVEYARKTDTGLINQGWKDSWDGVNFADGRFPDAPIALAEVQGYVYAAYRARAHLARETGDEAGARHWDGRAEKLKAAFNDAFWLPDRGWFAVGLDRDKRPIDALTSNIGHCLWTGILAEDKAAAVADLLLSPEMFSGWGIRTLATSMGAYNPMSYHNGSVWPHDNALCVAGLARYGHVGHAQRVTDALVEAAAHFGHRLPELFCGFDRDDFPGPVPYPTSCSPQAWAAASPLLLLRSLLRFDPAVPGGQLWCAPAIPSRYLPLEVTHLRLGEHDVRIHVDTAGWEVAGLDGTGITVIPALRDSESVAAPVS